MPWRTITLDGLPPFRIAVHGDNDRFISPEILKAGQWEPIETDIIRRCLQGGCDFYDVGANLGWYSVIAGLVLADGDGIVHAFEPAPENAGLLLHNVLDNQLSNVRVNPCALGASVGPINLYLSEDNKGDHQAHDGNKGRIAVPTSMTRFDHYYTPSRRRVFLKLDTQGSELAVVQGMGSYLQSIENLAMLIEFWPRGLEHAPGNTARLIALLSGAGLHAFSLTEDDPFLRPATWDVLAAAATGRLAPDTGAFVNLLLCRDGDPILAQLADRMHMTVSKHLKPL